MVFELEKNEKRYTDSNKSLSLTSKNWKHYDRYLWQRQDERQWQTCK